MKLTIPKICQALSPTWCPGCGNFAILKSLQQAVAQLKIAYEDLVIVYGVGCSGNMADFNRVYGFHALHGRAIANAVGIKLANHRLKVIVVAGDGDTYGEGLNHFLSAARGNHDITVLVHNNQMYSLTTGQSSPTTDKGTATKTTPPPTGVIEQPVNPLSLALAANAGFVARGYAGNARQLIDLVVQAVKHPGFALVDIFQPCPTFNKRNTYQWFQQRVYDLTTQKHDPQDQKAALVKAQEQEKLPIGLFYQNEKSQAYHQQLPQLKQKTLKQQWQARRQLKSLLKELK
ncbi:MAG: 2-oxoacid ferredoxin oxidoreductase [Candidatus Pacebacteria bacterium]|nr:2-oxoacid ferredoxin oxidoreductase [Candidatus Paceibacterota bacterium]